jgi:hypothetical protein
MRRRRSDELPRFVDEADFPSFRVRRRHAYYLIGFLFVCWVLYPSRKPKPQTGDAIRVNWSNYAYSMYATDGAELCHAVMVLDALARFGSKADRILFYPEHWDTRVDSSQDRDSQLLTLARDKYKAKLNPIQLLEVAGRTEGMYYANPYSPGSVKRDTISTWLTGLQAVGYGTRPSRSSWPLA